MPISDRRKMISALEKLAENGRKLLQGDVEGGYQVWKTEVLTVARMVFGYETPEYKDLDNGFWRYEEFIPVGSFKPKSDLVRAVKNVIDILEGQRNALGYDLELNA
jgi:hypothetical protein